MRVNQTAGNLIELFSNGPFVSQMSSVVSAFSVPIDSLLREEVIQRIRSPEERKDFCLSENNERSENIFFQEE